LIDPDREELRIEEDMRWAGETDSRVSSDAKAALRKLQDARKELESELQKLKDRRDYLVGVVEGKIKPGVIDLPADEAQNIGTKIKLRLKGVRGLAIEKARDELGSLEDKIRSAQAKMSEIDDSTAGLRDRQSEAKARLAELTETLKAQRAIIRQVSMINQNISAMVSTFGWFNPYLLGRKCLDEMLITRGNLLRAKRSIQKRSEEISELDHKITLIKARLKSVLGEAYDGCLIPIVFKGGSSPEGKKFLDNDLTGEDIKSLNLSSKLSHPKTISGRADRLRSILWDRRFLISESLTEIGHLGELKAYARRLLQSARCKARIAQRVLDSKQETFAQVLDVAEGCLALRGLAAAYDEQSREAARRRERAVVAVDRFRSDL